MIKRIFKYIFFKLISPEKYAKMHGVKLGKNSQMLTKNFGSEPYLISIGDNFRTSTGVQFVTHDGGVHVLRNYYEELKDIDIVAPIKIGNNVFIGMNTIILPNTIIEDNVIIGAGSILKGYYKSNSIYAGIPAKYITSLEEYKSKNTDLFLRTKYLEVKEKEKYLKDFFKEKL